MVKRPKPVDALTEAFADKDVNGSYPNPIMLVGPTVTLLLGLGDQDKTQPAIEYFQRAWVARRYRIIFWLNC
jgi:hypothetical protein